MKQYDTYKDSGVEWIGEIPENWKIQKLKYNGQAIIGITYNPNDITEKEDGLLVLRSSNVQDGRLAFDDCVYVKNNNIQAKHFTQPGDVLVCARNGSAHLVGKSAYIDNDHKDLTFGAFMSVIRSKHKKYLYYVLNSNLFKSQIGLFFTSTINQLTSDTLNNLDIVFPGSEYERDSIVSYLDHKTEQIDKVIKQKELLLEKLQAKRQAIINEAVTKGLNPNIPMKRSGVEWLGDIPEHWEVKKIRYEIEVLTDFTANGSFASLAENVEYLDEGYSRLVRLTDLRENLSNRGIYVNESAHKYLSKSELYGGEILLANVGAYAGLAWLMPNVNYPATLGPNMFLLRFKKSTDKEFAYYSLISEYLSSQLKQKAISAAQPKLNKENVRSCVYLCPPIKEQKQIVEAIKIKNQKLDNLVNTLKVQIEKLIQYRQSIISEVVTGKIKVV